MILTTLIYFCVNLGFLSYTTREIRVPVYALSKVRLLNWKKVSWIWLGSFLPASLSTYQYLVHSYDIYVHRSKFGTFKKEKNLSKVNWENALFTLTGNSPSKMDTIWAS